MRLSLAIVGALVAACAQRDMPAATNETVANGAVRADQTPSAREANTASQSNAVQEPGAGGAAAGMSPCLTQDSEELRISPLRAVGTEPFWAARVEGRCVTYMTPEDQKGTRVWTRYTPGPDGGIWSGALGGRRFELRTRSAPGCSDGMSDKSYPMSAEILVLGEERRGCAEPL